jgi:hypothetical protein
MDFFENFIPKLKKNHLLNVQKSTLISYDHTSKKLLTYS